jgi:flagellar assembly protein FliH
MATVIKSTLSARNALPIAFNFEDVAEHAKGYVDDVQARAAAIVTDAQRQADAISRRAEAEGRQAALRAVEKVMDEKVGKRMETLLPALEKVVAELSDARQSWLRHWEQSTVRLAARIAQRVIRRELVQQPEIKIDLVREAIEMASGSPHLRISLHPEDFESLGGQVQKLTQEIARAAAAEIVADETVSVGGCRVETRHGLIDQQIESQLERIVAELTGGNE